MFIDPAVFGESFDATDIDTGQTLRYPTGHKRQGEALFKRRFIPARLADNPYLSEQGDYEANLLSLPEHQRRQLLEGSWDISEGAAFTEFDRNVHVVEPYEIPKTWTKFRSCDYGYGSYSAVLWFAVNPDEQLIVYRELYVSKVLASDLADMVLELEQDDVQAPEQPRKLPLEDTLREIMLCDRRAGKERREVRIADSCRGRLLTQRVQGELQAGEVRQCGGGGKVGRRQRKGRGVLAQEGQHSRGAHKSGASRWGHRRSGAGSTRRLVAHVAASVRHTLPEPG